MVVPFNWLRKMGVKLTPVWDAKLKVILQLSPQRIDCRYVYPRVCKCGLLLSEDSTSMVPFNGSLCGQTEVRLGMPSESSHLATGP